MRGKRGQTVIFIIIGVILVAVIALILIFGEKIIPAIGLGKETNPTSFLDACMKEKIEESVKLISLQGGSTNPTLFKSFLFKDEKSPTDISYLCYNQQDNLPCVNQEPMLIQHLEDEIKNYISDEVKICFNKLTLSLERQNYVVDAKYHGFEIELTKGKIIINIDGELVLTKAGETSKQEDFKIFVGSRLYEIAEVVNRAVNDEVVACNFDYVFFMMNNPEFDIDKSKTEDSTEIYVIIHKDTNERFNLAIRGCVRTV